LKNARERSVRLSPKNSSPKSNRGQCTAARSEKNLPTASKNESKVWPIEVEAMSARTVALA